MGNKGGMLFIDLVKLLHDGLSPLSAVKQLCHDNRIPRQQMLYSAMRAAVAPLLRMEDEELEELGINLKKRTTTGLAAALQNLLD